MTVSSKNHQGKENEDVNEMEVIFRLDIFPPEFSNKRILHIKKQS